MSLITTVGLDIEFCLFTLSPVEFLPANTIIGGEYNVGSKYFGLDGHNAVGEIRPPQSTSVVRLTANLAKILESVRDTMAHHDVGMRVGHMAFSKPIGGHIHFGIPYSLTTVEKLKPYLTFFIDKGISDSTDNINHKRSRRSGSYGSEGEIRQQPWGLEYRSPGSFMHNPNLVLSYFALAKLCSIMAFTKDFDASRYEGTLVEKAKILLAEVMELVTEGKIDTDDIDDCQLGVKVLAEYFKVPPAINWSANILPNW